MNNVVEMKETAKGFWERKEGTFGKWFLGIAAIGSMYFVLPFLLEVASNAILLGIRACILGAGYVLLTSRRVAALYKALCWRITDWAIGLDPVGILKGYLERLLVYVRDIDKHMELLRGHIAKKNQEIAHKIAERTKCLDTVRSAGKDPERFKTAAIVNTKQAERLKGVIDEYTKLRDKLQNFYDVLNKIREFSNTKYLDIENVVNLEIEKRNSYKEASQVIRAVKKFLQGGDKEMYDAAMEKLANEYSAEIGVLEDFMQSTSGFLNEIDLENEGAAQHAMDLISQFESESLKNSKLMLDAPSNRMKVEIDEKEREKVPVGASRYSKIS